MKQCVQAIFILGLVTLNSASADDTPKIVCSPISRHVVEFSSKTLSTLTDREREHALFYFSELERQGRKKPNKLDILRNLSIWEPDWRFSIIFPQKTCANRCVGVAIIPGGSGNRIQEFSYRKNLLIIPSHTSPVAVDTFWENSSISAVFLNANNSGFIRLFDILQLPAEREWSLPNMKFAKNIKSITEPFQAHKPYENSYAACLNSKSEIQAVIGMDMRESFPHGSSLAHFEHLKETHQCRLV